MLEAAVKDKLKNIVVIDDAYAPAEARDIEGEAVSRFANLLQDEPLKVTQLVRQLKLKSLDPSVPQEIEDITQNDTFLSQLWNLREKQAWTWLDETLFLEYAASTNTRKNELDGLEQILSRFTWKVKKLHKFDPQTLDITACQVIFLDFFLKEETAADSALDRAVQLGQMIVGARHAGTLVTYPLVVLMSSRTGAGDNQQEFKRRTGLRADFFCFIEKSQIESGIDAKLALLLSQYKEKQALAHLLDEYWVAAFRAATSLRSDLALLEPSELALLHEAELGVEEAILPDYLSWLVTETVSAKMLGDSMIRDLRGKLPELVGRCAFPGSVPPGSLIADMYVRSVMRLDVNDDVLGTKQFAVALGDLFGRFNAAGVPEEMWLVVDQSCDLARPENKKNVLCLQCSPSYVSDVALAFYRNPAYNNGKVGDLIPVQTEQGTKYYLAKWDIMNPITPKLADLSKRKNRLKRLARYKPIRALARQELLTQQVGRIGEPVVPPNAVAYKAKLVLLGKSQFKVEFDATKQPWASVVIVQGRHLPLPIKSTEPAGKKGKKPDQPTKAKSTQTTSNLSFTTEFTKWTKGKLELATVSDTVASSQKTLLLAKLTEDALQRVQLKQIDDKSSKDKSMVGTGFKATVSPVVICVVFGSSVPESAKEEKIVLLLTPYAGLDSLADDSAAAANM